MPKIQGHRPDGITDRDPLDRDTGEHHGPSREELARRAEESGFLDKRHQGTDPEDVSPARDGRYLAG